MKRSTFAMLALLMAVCLLNCPSASAQELDDLDAPSVQPTDKDWYYGPTAQPEAKSAGKQRAEMRAQQRLARLSSMRWYGFTPGRPTAAGMPFTTMYSPAWTRPGGRPFGWYISQRPTVVVSPSYPVYYR